ncbi:MAG: IS1595 family transposase [Methanoregula sp.]|nr:IS1595 family transposase [Methanoregula sp.]
MTSSHQLPLRLTKDQWREILHLFLMELSSNSIVEQTGLDKKRVLRALLKVRVVLTTDVPAIFSGTVEVDETYLWGAWRNKRKVVRDTGTRRGRGISKQPVFGILCRNGQVWAEIVGSVDEATLLPLITKKVEPGSTVCSDTWKAYTGVAAKGYVHRLVQLGMGSIATERGITSTD